MNKKLMNIIVMMVAVLTVGSLVSCTKDDSSKTSIDGVWALKAKMQGGSYNTYDKIYDYVEFKNGKMSKYHSTYGCKFSNHILYSGSSFTLRDQYKYSVKGSTLNIYDDGDVSSYEFEIDKGTKLTIEKTNGYEEYSSVSSIVSETE